MNWTEGSLARHSRRKGWNEEAARKKEYFAKKRATRRNASSLALGVTSFVPDYIPQPANGNHHVSGPSSTLLRSSNRARSRLLQLASGRNHATDSDVTHSSSPGSWGNGHDPVASDKPTNMTSKRRKLLEKSDWTGVEFQKPLYIESSRKQHTSKRQLSPKQRGLVRGEPPSHGQKRRHASKEVASPCAAERLRIRIGSQDYRWSQGANSIRSPLSGKSRLSTWQDWMKHQDASSSAGVSPRIASSSHSVSTGVPDRVSSNRHIRVRESLKDSPRMTLANAHRHLGLEGTSLERQHLTIDPQIVILSSPPMMHHPKPTRREDLRILELRSPCQNSEDSLVVQIDSAKRAADRITKQDTSWAKWLSPNDRVRTPVGKDESARVSSPEKCITPGISHYWSGSDATSPCSGEIGDVVNVNRGHIRSDPVIEAGESSSNHRSSSTPSGGEVARQLSMLSQAPRSDIESVVSHDTQSLDCEPSDTQIQKQSSGSSNTANSLVLAVGRTLPKEPNVRDLMDLLEEEGPGHQTTKFPADLDVASASEDEDEVWKKFVLDDNCSEINRVARKEAQEQTTRELYSLGDPPARVIAEPPSSDRWVRLASPLDNTRLLGPLEGPSASVVAEPPSSDQGGSEDTPSNISRQPCSLEDPPTSVIAEPPSSDQAVRLATSLDTSFVDGAKSETTASTDDPSPVSHDTTMESTIGHPGSPKPPVAGLTFHQPRLFVGRLASLPGSSSGRPTIQAAKRGRGRRTTREHGRPDIRAMPNFDGDPIEESP